MAKRGGAVARAVEGGSAAENVDAGLSELIGLAERSGPPRVPHDVGNFNPEGARPARGANRAAARSPQARATVTPMRRAQHVQTFDDEQLERDVQGERSGVEESFNDDPNTRSFDDQGDEQDVDQRGGAAHDTGFDDQAQDDEELDPRDRELADLRAWRQEQENRQAVTEARLETAIRMQSGQAQPNAQAGTANDPRAAAIANAMAYNNLLVAGIDEASMQTLGLTPQGARTLETFLRVNLEGFKQKFLQAYTLDQEYTRAQVTTAQQADKSLENVTAAFWQANPDLTDYEWEVSSLSKQIAEAHPHVVQDPALWVKTTATAVRNHLARRGIRTSARAGQQVQRDPRQFGSADQAPRRVRPATMDMPGTGGGFSGGAGRRLDPVTKDILDLVRFSG